MLAAFVIRLIVAIKTRGLKSRRGLDEPAGAGEPSKELSHLREVEVTVGGHTEGKRMEARGVEHRMERSVTLPKFDIAIKPRVAERQVNEFLPDA